MLAHNWNRLCIEVALLFQKTFGVWLKEKDNEFLYWKLYDNIHNLHNTTKTNNSNNNNDNTNSNNNNNNNNTSGDMSKEDKQNAQEITMSYVIKTVNGWKGFEKLKDWVGNLSFKDFVSQGELEEKAANFLIGIDWTI